MCQSVRVQPKRPKRASSTADDMNTAPATLREKRLSRSCRIRTIRWIIFLVCFSVPAFGSLASVYIAQSAAGSGNGSTCGAAEAYSFFNSSSNWGKGSSKIGPGTTVYVCGTITGSGAGNTILTFQGSGSSGSPITLQFQSGASLQNTYCGIGACLNLHGQTYLIVNGGTNGLIEATANGTSGTSNCPAGACANQQQSVAIIGFGNNTIIENLTIGPMYVRSGTTDEAPSRLGVDCVVVGTNSNGLSNVEVNNNVIHDCLNGVNFQYGTSASNFTISNNQIYNVNWAMDIIGYSGVNYDSIYLIGNHTYNLSTWDDTVKDDFHHNALHLFQGNGTDSTVSHLFIYNNEFDGPVGDCCVTAQIYIDNNGTSNCCSSSYVFNNVFSYADGDCTRTCGNGLLNVSSGNGWTVYNNTFIGDDTRSGQQQGECAQFYTVTGSNFENNLVTGCSNLIEAKNNTKFASGSPDYNLYAHSGSNAFVSNGTDYRGAQIASWRAHVGNETHSAYSSSTVIPNCTGMHNCANVQPQSGSHAIGFGTNLFSICNRQANPGLGALCYDKAGNARPSSGAWTVGAYSNPGTPPIPPTGLTQ